MRSQNRRRSLARQRAFQQHQRFKELVRTGRLPPSHRAIQKPELKQQLLDVGLDTAKVLWHAPRIASNVLEKAENIPFVGEAVSLIPGERQVHQGLKFVSDVQSTVEQGARLVDRAAHGQITTGNLVREGIGFARQIGDLSDRSVLPNHHTLTEEARSAGVSRKSIREILNIPENLNPIPDIQRKLSEQVGDYTQQHLRAQYGEDIPELLKQAQHVVELTSKRGPGGEIVTRDSFPMRHRASAPDINFNRAQHALGGAQQDALDYPIETHREQIYSAAMYVK